MAAYIPEKIKYNCIVPCFNPRANKKYQARVFTWTQNFPRRIQSPNLSLVLIDECQTAYTTQMSDVM